MNSGPDHSRKILTICIIHDHPRVLLGMKKRGFGAGRWNGFGGKVAPGESIEDAAIREMREEAGMEIVDMEKIGVLEFEFENDPKILETHLFKVHEWKGEPIETEEMKPQWFTTDEIPFGQMWSDDLYWMPYFLKGMKFKARFKFDQPSTPEYSSKIIERHIAPIKDEF